MITTILAGTAYCFSTLLGLLAARTLLSRAQFLNEETTIPQFTGAYSLFFFLSVIFFGIFSDYIHGELYQFALRIIAGLTLPNLYFLSAAFLIRTFHKN